MPSLPSFSPSKQDLDPEVMAMEILALPVVQLEPVGSGEGVSRTNRVNMQ